MTPPGRVVVLGSVNVDLVMRVEHLPARGETVLADAVHRRLGGKGANQAVAACDAGAPTTLLGAVGDDDAADELVARLSGLGVDVARLRRGQRSRSGLAVVAVAVTGDNQIVVSAGANGSVGSDYVDSVADAIGAAEVLVVQGELPTPSARAAMAVARSAGTRIVVNLAPVRDLGADLEAADPLVVNGVEAGQLLDATLASAPDVCAAAGRLRGLARSTVVTLGAEGAVLVTGDAVVHLPASTELGVEDTTGAGDTFVGTLAAALARHETLGAATARAVDAATRSVATGGRTRFDLAGRDGPVRGSEPPG